ncbi:hypothetical protein TNCV_3498541 [Trichonephila clavipes]|nr:hypothetical protein TNCV_3498541 [Trichonephila clavipes]
MHHSYYVHTPSIVDPETYVVVANASCLAVSEITWSVAKSPRVAEKCDVNIQSINLRCIIPTTFTLLPSLTPKHMLLLLMPPVWRCQKLRGPSPKALV